MDAVQTSVLSLIALIVCFTVSLFVCCCCARIWGRRRYQPTPTSELNRPLYIGRSLPGRTERLQQSFERFSASVRRKFRRQRSINRALASDDGGGLTLNPSVYHRMESGQANDAFENLYANEEPACFVMTSGGRPPFANGSVGGPPSNGNEGGPFQLQPLEFQGPFQQQVEQLQNLYSAEQQQRQHPGRPGGRGRRQNESAV